MQKKHWIDANFLKNTCSQQPELRENQWEIEIAQEDTCTHVNRLLEEETITYIQPKWSQDTRFIEPWEHAFKFTERSIKVSNESVVPILPNISVTLEGDNIIYDGVTYTWAQLQQTEYVWIVDRSDIQPSPKKNQPWYSSWNTFVPVSKIKERFVDTDVRTISLMEVTRLPANKVNNQRFLAWYFPNWDMSSLAFTEHVRTLFEKSKEIFEKRAFVLTSHKAYKNFFKNFNSVSGKRIIAELIKKTQSKNRHESIIACSMLKFMFLLNKYSENDTFTLLLHLEEEEKNMNVFLRDVFNLPKDVDIQRDNRWIYIFKKEFPEYDNTVVEIWFRVKSLSSIIQKSLSKAEYLELDSFRDIFAMSVYIPEEKTKYTLSIMQEFDTQIFNSDWRLKNKWLLDDNTIELHKQVYPTADAEVLKKYEEAAETDTKQIGTSENYDDVKIVWTYYTKDWKEVGTETKFLYGKLQDDANEVGTAFHPVFDYFSKYFAGEKNRNPFITAKTLSDLLDDFYPYLKKEAEKYGKTYVQCLRELFDELPKKNKTKRFPEKDFKRFYDNTIKKQIFKYLANTYELEQVKIQNEWIAFTTKYNREQLSVGLRWFRLKHK